eukprot:TRINITY_DN18756_c0_g1_i1.p1 TRINITY_DN18756_c0_g1~~TRINITY_DN18756_c0_g1_i1.p1  ORF type:complete len:844 (-),score=188.31 TRINITY_DN18756_c0_g1_i1:84-2615(-)
MADLLQPPFDFEKEELVTGSIEISTQRLAGSFTWLVACVKEQNKLLGNLCSRVDGFQAGDAASSTQSLQTSMKEEMLSMQFNTLRHEVGSLPRSGDLDRQRERIMAEVASLSNSISDRQRDSDERMNRELANVTDTLCKQLERISNDVASRLTGLEGRLAATSTSGEAGEATSTPALASSSLPAAAGTPQEEVMPATTVVDASEASRAEMAALEARVVERIEAMERQLTELVAQQTAQPVPAAPTEQSQPGTAASGVDSDAIARVASAAAAETVAAAREADQEAIRTLREALALVSVQVEEFKVDLSVHSKEIDTMKTQVQVAAGSAPAEPASPAAQESPPVATTGSATAMVPANLDEALAPIRSRLDALEASLRSMQFAMPELKTDLEASIKNVEKALATVEARATSQQGAATSVADLASPEPSTQSAEATPLESAPRESAASADASSQYLNILADRLKSLEDWRDTAQERLQNASFSPAIADIEGVGEEADAVLHSDGVSEESQRVARQDTRSFDGPPGGRWRDVQAELEHFRKLFEFIEGVLPEDAAEAMRFFNRRQHGREELSAKVKEALGPDVDFEGAKSKLQSEFNTRTLDLHREFGNLMLAIKGLQRDMDSSGGKIRDLGQRMMQFESEAKEPHMLQFSLERPSPSVEDPHQEPSPRQTGLPSPQEETRNGEALNSNGTMDQKIEELRRDVTNWLDMLRQSVLEALQSKADHEQVSSLLKQLVSSNQPGDTLAHFAKRALIGRCASCDAPIDVDMARVKRPQAVPLPGPWPVLGDNLGAKIAIRPLAANPQTASSSKLPKIAESRNAQASKSRSLKSSGSAPDVRSKDVPKEPSHS